jgi:hypothetical protein
MSAGSFWVILFSFSGLGYLGAFAPTRPPKSGPLPPSPPFGGERLVGRLGIRKNLRVLCVTRHGTQKCFGGWGARVAFARLGNRWGWGWTGGLASSVGRQAF